MPLDYKEFAKKIKNKYPEYSDVDDLTLSKKMVDKYPEYKNEVYFETPLKKKEVSQSTPKQKLTSSDISKTDQKQPSVSSVNKNNALPGEYLYYEGKGTRRYYDGKWYDYNYSEDRNGKQVDIYDKQITDPTRVNILNKHFGKVGSTSANEDVFTGYPGQEKNQYRVIEDKWQKKMPGQEKWRIVTNEGSIQSLNKEFKKNVSIPSNLEELKRQQEEDIIKDKKLNSSLTWVNSGLIGSEEDEASEILKKKFPGFDFIKQGALTDELLVVAPNGAKTKISLDNWTDEDDRKQSTVLREFIKNNSDEKLVKSANDLRLKESQERTFIEDQKKQSLEAGVVAQDWKWDNGKLIIETPLDKAKKSQEYQDIKSGLKESRKEYMSSKAQQFDDIYYRFKDQPKNNDEMIAAYASIKADNQEIKRVNDYVNDIKNNSNDFKKEKSNIESYTNSAILKLQSGEITQEEFDSEYKPEIEKRVSDLNEKSKSLSNELKTIGTVNNSINQSVAKNYLIKEATGSIAGGVASKFINGFTYLPRLASMGDMSKKDQEDIVNLITGGGTTKEYMESEKRSDVSKALFSMSESLGILTSSAILGGSTAYPSFYAQSYYEMKDELDSIPQMSETEKVIMSGAYGVISSALEKFGIDAVTQKTKIGKNLTNNIIKGIFTDLPKNASKEFIDAAISNNIKKYVVKSGLQAAIGAGSEGITESLQNLTSVGVKEVYDLAKGTEYFNNKSAWNILGDAVYEGWLGALGGGVMSTVTSSADIIKKGVVSTLNKEQINTLINSANVEGIDEALLTNLKSSILTGNITSDEAKEINDSFHLIKSKLNSLPDNMSTDDKSVSLDLLIERDKLQKESSRLDEALRAPYNNRIAEINNKLLNISENAVQKQTTSEVPVQPETRVGREMEEGKPQAEPEVVTEEGEVVTKEEVIPTEEEIDLETKLFEDLNLIKSETKPRLRVEDINIPAEEDINIETIETNLDKLPAYEVNFVTPTLSQDIQVNPIEESKSQVKEGAAEVRTIESFEGIPMVVGMSDTLAAGTVKDSTGNPMDVEGGLLYNVLGKNKNAAWAGVTEEGALTQYNEALELYNNNKNLFDKLWSEGKLPNGHVPMAIMKMADTAINSNEAVFRYLSPLVKSQPESNQQAALEALKADIETKKKVKQDVTVNSANKLDQFISSKNINSLGELFDAIVTDANNRAKGDTKNTLSLTERSLLFDLMISPQGIKDASKNTVNALFGAKKDPRSKAFLADTIYNDIAEPSMMKTPKGNMVSVVGIDVLNGGVIKVDHGNYGFGPKGQMIALISNPKHGLDVFPEWKAKATRVFKQSKKGVIPSDQKIGDEVGGAFYIDKAFRGAKVSMETSDIELLSAKLRFAFPDVTVSNSKEEFDRVLQEEGIRTKESNGKVILGMTKDGKIYLNPESDSLATPIHEFGHIWIDFLRSSASGKKGDALLSKGLSLVEGTKALEQAISKYGDNALAREEALVELMATKGETIIDKSKKKEFKNWLNALFKYVKEFFITSEELFKGKEFEKTLKEITLDDFINIGLADLLKGTAVSPKFKAKEVGKSAAELRFSLGDNVQNFINKARAQGYSEDSIKNVLTRNGVSIETINTAMGKAEKAAKKIEITEEFAPGYDRLLKEITGIVDKSRKRGRSESDTMQNAIDYLQKSKVYENATDVQREAMIRNVRSEFKKREKIAPSAAKILGKPKAKKVVIKDEYKEMIRQIKMEAKAAREAKADLNSKRKMLAAAISGMVKTGKVKASQAAVLVKRVSNLNLDNPVMVERFTNYAQRVFERADYQQRLNDAFAIRKGIRKALKTDNQAEVVGMAKEFTKIDPSLVEDIDAYMEIAEKVKNAVKPSRVKGLDVVMKESANIAEVSEYTNEEIARQEDIQRNEFLATYDFLDNEMSLEEMQKVIDALKDPTSKMDTTEKEKYVKDYLNARFGIMSSILDTMFKTGIDPMTGEEITFDEKQKELIKRALKIELNEMSVREAIKIVESLENFLTNQITSGLEAAVSSYEGAFNDKQLVEKGFKAKSLKFLKSGKIGRGYTEQLFSLPLMIEKMFGGINKSIEVMNKWGLSNLINGVNKGNKQFNTIIDSYMKQEFYKSKGFMDAENVYERGMLAFLKRNLVGNPTEMKAEFERRVRMIQESINKLIEDGSSKEKKMGELYQKIYDKLDVSKMDMDVINANASKNNLDSVNWWINQWSKHYSDLSDISLSVYNTQLGSDLNYTPDKYKKLSSEEVEFDKEAIERNSSFAISMDYTDKKKTGVLMETTRPNTMPDGRYISLDFDTNNAKSLKAALVDINTASAIRQIDGFMSSNSFKKLIPEADDRKIIVRRINTYIRRAKGKNQVPSDTMQDVERFANFVTALGVGKALGGVSQAVTQTIPVMFNTVINSGRFDVADANFNAWLDDLGVSTSNRGLESQSTVESIDRQLEASNGNTQKIIKGVENLSQFYLKQFLSRPDIFVARSSFKSYYLQNLKRRGISTDIDWRTHKPDMEAVEYAEAMVNRQQNVSDPMLAGEFLASDDPMRKMTRKGVFPFASFILNQKARMYNDLNTIFNGTSTTEDKVAAARSLAGLAVELATFQLIGFGIRRLYDSISAALLGDEDDEETKRKKMINATKYPIKNIVNDIISPLPGMTDVSVTWALNTVLSYYPWMDDKEVKDAVKDRNKILELKGEDPMDAKTEAEFIKNIKDEATYQVFKDENDRQWGMYGIASATYQELFDVSKLATTGEFIDDYQGRETTKKLLESDREKVKYAVPFVIAYSTGLLPKDVGTISENYIKRIKKKAVTEKQYDRYETVQKDLGRNLKSWEIEMVKDKKESETAISEIKFIERNGGLTERQGREYLKLMKAIGEPTVSDLTKIKNGQTADQILK